MQRPLREDIGYAQRVIEMTVADEKIPGAGLRRRSPPDVEGETGRVNAEPGLLPRDRAALDRQLSELQSGGAQRPEGGAGGRAARRQISWYMKRRSGSRRLLRLSWFGSISQSAAATEESSEFPSWGVKQKP